MFSSYVNLSLFKTYLHTWKCPTRLVFTVNSVGAEVGAYVVHISALKTFVRLFIFRNLQSSNV